MEALWQVLEYVRQGGWIMIPLGIVSAVMWLLIAERIQAFHNLTRRDIKIQEAIRALDGDPIEVSGDGLRSALMSRFLDRRVGEAEIDRRILRESAMKIRPYLSRFIAVIAVLAGVAPLLGLLGTVIGMIETFDVIAIFGTGNAKALAGGISVALVTTQSGLLVAIPGLTASAMLSKRAAKLERSLEEATLVLEHHLKQSLPHGGEV